MSGSVQTPARQGCRGVLRPKAAIASPPHTVISWERDLGTNVAWISKHSSGGLGSCASCGRRSTGHTLIQLAPLPAANCVTASKLFTLSEPQILHWYDEANTSIVSKSEHKAQ